jgi:hypothetical protein
MDTTAIGIILALACCAAYVGLKLWRHKKFSPGGVFVVSAAGFSVPAGAQLIKAALTGDATDLPSNWREYVTAAGVVLIGLSLQYLLTVFRSVLTRSATEASGDKDGGGEQ